MSSTVYDLKTGSFVQSTAHNIALTSILSTDLLIVVASKYSASTLTISGFGTWTQWGTRQVAASNTRLIVWTLTGVSGSGNITLTSGSTTFLNQYTVYVLRGLASTTITASGDSTWYDVNGSLTGTQTTTPSNTDEGPSAISVGADQVAVFVAVVNAGASTGATFPSNTTPSGWTTDSNPTGAGQGLHHAAHVILTTTGTVQANMRMASTVAIGTLMLVAGTAVTPPPSGFDGWGVPI